ncbi:MAG: DUF2974 domain-containing protein, partial [Azoarcus sp.]|nr:DUF2974 domain-containing protein [Azoarcus sp.]
MNPDNSGFEAATFQNGSELVISFAGTQPGSSDWNHGNVPLANGVLSDQLRQAAEYYLSVKAANPGAAVTLTGHSLGGGLASLIAVMFDEAAVTFDQAPFRMSAQFFHATDDELTMTHSVAQELRTYLTGLVASERLTRLDAYIAAGDRLNTDPIPGDTLAGREAKVANINVEGEVLGYLPFGRIGATQTDIPNNSPDVSIVDLHSQALLAAFLQSEQTTSSGHTLNQVTFKLPDLLKMIFDKALFAFDVSFSNTENENFLERLIKHEAGNGGGVAESDGMVTRFTSDLWKLAQDSGLAMSDSNVDQVNRALIAFAMQKYYEEAPESAGYKQELFTTISGGLQFYIADVAQGFRDALAAGQTLNLDEAKGFAQYLKDYLQQTA